MADGAELARDDPRHRRGKSLDVAAVLGRKLQMGDLMKLGDAHGEPLSSPMSIGIIPTICPFLLPVVLPAVQLQYPRLELQISEEQSQVLVEECQLYLEQDEKYLFHELLEADNHPCYFQEFVAQAAKRSIKKLIIEKDVTEI